MKELILVLDHDKQSADKVATYLKENSYPTVPVYSINEAIEYLRSHSVGIFLADISYPGEGAHTLLAEMDKVLDYSPRIIFMTGLKGQEPNEKVLKKTQNSLQLKPVDLRKLLEAVIAVTSSIKREADFVLIDPADFNQTKISLILEGKKLPIPVDLIEIDSHLVFLEFSHITSADRPSIQAGISAVLEINGGRKNSHFDVKLEGQLVEITFSTLGRTLLKFKPKLNDKSLLSQLDLWIQEQQTDITNFLKAAKGK